jgi:hypothetical protein
MVWPKLRRSGSSLTQRSRPAIELLIYIQQPTKESKKESNGFGQLALGKKRKENPKGGKKSFSQAGIEPATNRLQRHFYSLPLYQLSYRETTATTLASKTNQINCDEKGAGNVGVVRMMGPRPGPGPTQPPTTPGASEPWSLPSTWIRCAKTSITINQQVIDKPTSNQT